MASHPVIKLEGPQPAPYFYPDSPNAKVINVPDYKIVNYNFLFEYASKSGQHRDRLPLWNPMKMSRYVDPFTGQRFEPLPPILFDQVGQPAGWGVNVGDLIGRGPDFEKTLIGAGDIVLTGYRGFVVDVVVEWPCFLHCPPFKFEFAIGEGKKHRAYIARKAGQAIQAFLNASAKWTVDPVNRYWAPQCARSPRGISPYEMRLVALVNTHEKHWRCDISIVRALKEVPKDCSPTLLDPIQYKFF